MASGFENFHDGKAAGCAGAAKYRANTGSGKLLHPNIGRLPEDHEAVFSSPQELIAHHRGISIEEAKELLRDKSVLDMLVEEMEKSKVVRVE